MQMRIAVTRKLKTISTLKDNKNEGNDDAIADAPPSKKKDDARKIAENNSSSTKERKKDTQCVG